MKKKILLSLLVVLSLFLITGCGDKKDNSNKSNNKTMNEASKEYTKNSDDDKYFKPATDDYIMFIVKNTGRTDITLVAFDEYGKAVQKVEREEYTDKESTYESFIANEHQNVSSDKKVMYDNKTSLLEHEEKTTTEKFRIIHDYTFEANNDDNAKLFMSKGLTSNDTKSTRIDDSHSAIQALKIVASGFDSDYMISVRKDKVNKATHYADYRGIQVLVYNAFSYYPGSITFYDNNGNVVKSITAYVFDNASMIEDYKMHGQSKITSDAKAVLDEETYNNMCKQTNCNIKNNVFYQVNSDESLRNEYSTKKWNDLIDEFDGTYTYFSDPKLSESQIHSLYKSKR